MFTRQRYISDDSSVVDTTREVATPVASSAWSPAQIVGLVFGVGFAVLGIAAVVRTGFDTSHIYTPHMLVWHLPHSPLLGACEIAFGALMIIASVVPGGMRSLMGFLGAVAVVFGLVILVGSTPARLTHWFAVTNRSGVFFTVAGAVILLTSILSPVFFTSRQRVQHVRTYA